MIMAIAAREPKVRRTAGDLRMLETIEREREDAMAEARKKEALS
jgi:hypothetical protein